MKSLKVFFTFIVIVMFVMTSCNKEENLVADLQVNEIEMIPSSEFYDNYEENIDEFIEELQNMEVTDRVGCPGVSNVSIEPIALVTTGPCVELRAEITRDDLNQMIRIVHILENGFIVDDIYADGGSNSCLDIPDFTISPSSITKNPNIGITTYVVIMDTNGGVARAASVQWYNPCA